jgi:hypothetical protein
MAGLMRELRILTGAEAMLMAFQDEATVWSLLRMVETHGRNASQYAKALQQRPRGYPLNGEGVS